MKLEVKQIYHGVTKNIGLDDGNLYILNNSDIIGNNKVIPADGVTDFEMIQSILYTLKDGILYRQATVLSDSSLYRITTNELKQHIVYSFNDSIITKITLYRDNHSREEFNLPLIDFVIVEYDLLLACTSKHLALYYFGNNQPWFIINDYKLSLPMLGAYKYKYIIDKSFEYIYIVRYKGCCIYKKNLLIFSVNLPFPVSNGIIIGGFLYCIDDNMLKVIHLYTSDCVAYDITGTLLKSSQGAYLNSNNCLYKITVSDLKDIQITLCNNNLHPMALDSLLSNQDDFLEQQYWIKAKFIRYLVENKQHEHACQLMLDISYPLVDFIHLFPEVIPSKLDISQLNPNHVHSDKQVERNTLYPFLPYLSSKRVDYPIIDTIMFYIYSKINTSLLKSLIRVENACDLDTCGTILLDMGMIKEWILFYFSKNSNSDAFKLMISNKFESKYFLEYYDLLVQHNETDWLLDHLDYFLKEFKDLEYFINHPAFQSSHVRSRICELLQFDLYLQRQYLSEIVLKKKANKFHVQLILVQVEIIKNLNVGIDDDKMLQERLVLREYLSYDSGYGYNELVPILGDLNLDFEVALVYKTLNQHESALKIYVVKMNNYVEAEKYCFDAYYKSHQINVYNDLFHVIKQHQPEKVVQFAIDHVDYLDPLQVLSVIPNHTDLKNVLSWVDKGLKVYNREYQRASMNKNQLKIHHSRLRQERYVELNRKCFVDAYKVCYNCNRRIGDKACYMYTKNLCCANCIPRK
eukprot:NODE_11_length_46995_cov_0.451872.p5 type:complete len:747 gc:universal NODE_11_length_46995_cov_0.451872:12002-14242(+)